MYVLYLYNTNKTWKESYLLCFSIHNIHAQLSVFGMGLPVWPRSLEMFIHSGAVCYHI